MKRLFACFKGVFLRLKGRFPKRLPVGMSEFNSFADSVFHTYSLPDSDTYRHAMCSMIMHLPPTQTFERPYFFAKSIKKAMVNETAFAVMEGIRQADKTAREARAKELEKEKGLALVEKAGE